MIIYNTIWVVIVTRGPGGPWVAHLRKRSKVTVEPIIENPRGIIFFDRGPPRDLSCEVWSNSH